MKTQEEYMKTMSIDATGEEKLYLMHHLMKTI